MKLDNNLKPLDLYQTTCYNSNEASKPRFIQRDILKYISHLCEENIRNFPIMNFNNQTDIVMLRVEMSSRAKKCHPERSEGSHSLGSQILSES